MNSIKASKLNLLMRRIGHRYRQLTARELATLGLHVGQEAYLLALGDAGVMTQVQLAGSLDVEAPTIGGMTQRLERDGLVYREPDAADRRVWLVRLTPAGRTTLTKLRRALNTVADLATAEYPGELDGLLRTLERFANAIPPARSTQTP